MEATKLLPFTITGLIIPDEILPNILYGSSNEIITVNPKNNPNINSPKNPYRSQDKGFL